MPVRIKDGIIPYTGGQGIEITDNHVINVLLREMNNLIEVNGDRELYVDLQLPAGIRPTDTFPVGVTTGKILQADGWQQSGLILNWKTTSGDYNRLIYANDGKLYHDKGDGVWRELGGGERCVHLFPMPEVNDDITDLYTSAIYNERYVTVIDSGEYDALNWYVTGMLYSEDGQPGHIYAMTYGTNPNDKEYYGISTVDIAYVEYGEGQQICTGVTINTNLQNGAVYDSTAPSNPTQGQLWYDTTTSVLKIYDGSNWINVSNNSAGFTPSIMDISSVSTAQDWLDAYLADSNMILVRYLGLLFILRGLNTSTHTVIFDNFAVWSERNNGNPASPEFTITLGLNNDNDTVQTFTADTTKHVEGTEYIV